MEKLILMWALICSFMALLTAILAGLEGKNFDTHLGSGSSRISADKVRLDFTAFEINPVYYHLQEKRYINYKGQLRIDFG